MFEFLFRKERELETLIYSYLENIRLVLDHFEKAMDVFLDKGLCDEFHFRTDRTHKSESKADEIREEINLLMYSKALIPESREDVMRLIETMDGIARKIELVLFMIGTQKISPPYFIAMDIKELIRVSLESCELMIRQVDVMFKKKEGIRSLLATIDHNESQCDHMERNLIAKVFESELDSFVKLQLRDMIVAMGDISDEADRVSKQVNIMTMKRRI